MTTSILFRLTSQMICSFVNVIGFKMYQIKISREGYIIKKGEATHSKTYTNLEKARDVVQKMDQGLIKFNPRIETWIIPKLRRSNG